jgi:tetratricopeptide (TPR) repeat protein
MRFSGKFLSFLFLFILSQGFAQVTYKEFIRTSDVSKKLVQAHDLWEYYIRNNTDSLKNLALETFEFGNQKKSEALKHFSKRILGCYLVRNGDFQSGEKELKIALSYHRKNGDFAKVAEDLNELGISNFLKGDFHSAESFFNLSLKAGKESPDETHAFLAELNLAKIYDKLDLKEKAKAIANHYLTECKRLKKMEATSTAYGFLSDLALNEKKNELAEEYLTKSLDALKSNSSIGPKAQIHSNFGAFYATKEDFKKAKDHFNQALELRLKSNYTKGILEAYYNLGSVEYLENNYSKAETFYLKGLELAKEFNLFSDQIDFLEVLVEVQKEKKDKDKEIEFYQEFIDVKSKQAEFLLKNKEEQANLIEYFQNEENKSSAELVNTSNFWSGFLVGISSLLIVLLIIRFFKPKLVRTEKHIYDE